ncbi:MAG TPA: hypothetical protein DCW31_06355 [Lactobacillus sp.]|nr:hypothetical protein [Lactobacillus sp.]
MDQRWREQAIAAVRRLLLWAAVINIFSGVVLSLTMLTNGASFLVYAFMLLPAVVGVWELSKLNQLTDRWLINGSTFYGQAIISVLFASWVAAIFLFIAGHRLQVIAAQHYK